VKAIPVLSAINTRHKAGWAVFLLTGILLVWGCGPSPEEAASAADKRIYGAIEKATKKAGLEQNDYYRLDDPNQREAVRAVLPQNSVLTLTQAAAMAVTYNRDYLLERDNLFQLASGVTDIQHLYEIIPGGSIQEDYLRQDGQETVGTAGGLGLGLRQLLAAGTQVGANLSLTCFDLLSGGDGSIKSGFASVFSATVTQPLLRGASRKAVLETLTQAERDLLYQIRYFNRYRKTFLVTVLQTYYETLQFYDQMNNARRYYLTLAEIHRQTQKQAAVGRVPLFEVEQTYQDQLDALNTYIDLRNDYGQMLDTLKTMLAIRPDTELVLDIQELEALKAFDFAELNFSEEAAIQAALNQRLDLANAADRVLDAQRHVEIAAEMLGADLALIGTTSVGSFGASPDDLRRTEDMYNLSLRMDLPLDRKAEQNRYRLTLAELMQNQRTHQGITDQVIQEVRSAFRNLRTAHEQYRLALNAQELAQKRMHNTLRLQKVGRANMRDVLDAHEDYYEAQENATDALVEYAVAALNLYLATDTLKVQPDGQLLKSADSFGNSMPNNN